VKRSDVAKLLTFIASIDKRTIGETDINAWAYVLAPLDPDRCMTAVVTHLRRQPGVWIEPGHVWMLAKTSTDGDATRDPSGGHGCEHGHYCSACHHVHHDHEPCFGQPGTPLLDKRADLKAITADLCVMPALPAAANDLHDQPIEDADPHTAAAVEAERRRQIDALEAMGVVS